MNGGYPGLQREDELRKAWSEIAHLKALLLEEMHNSAQLRIQVSDLRAQLEGRTLSDKEKRLVQVAKSILAEIGQADG